MADITVDEKPYSPKVTRGANPRCEIAYGVTVEASEDPLDAQEALDAVDAVRPSGYVDNVHGNLPYQNATIEWETPWACTITVEYSRNSLTGTAPLAPGGSTLSFEVGSETFRQKVSIETVGTFVPPDALESPIFDKQINVNDDGVAEGVDIDASTFEWAETHAYEAGDWSFDGIAELHVVRGWVNATTWRIFAAGEVKFVGVSGGQRADGTWELTFRFKAIPNKTDLQIGDIEDIEKAGWDYLWVKNARVESAGMVVTKPVAVMVEQMFEVFDFDDLDLD